MIINKHLFKHTHTLITQLGHKPTIIIGLSGGPDSVFLLYLLKQISSAGLCSLVGAHLNHGWRAEAGEDATWCKALCKKLAIPFVEDHGNNYPIDKKYNGSAEAMGRKKRQLFYATVKTQYQAAAIALGHHQDDQLETFFIRLARGTSLSGLHGMDAFDGTYLRPLLNTSKQEILDWLTANNISYLIDTTNAQDSYLRNRIRHYLVPVLEKCDTRLGRSITNTMARLKDEDQFLDELTHTAFSKLIDTDGKLKLAALCTLHNVLQQRILLHWLIDNQVSFTPSAHFLAEILRFLHTPRGGIHSVSPTVRVVKKQGYCWLDHQTLQESTNLNSNGLLKPLQL